MTYISQFLNVETPGKGHDLEPCSLPLRQSLEGEADGCLPTAPQHLEQPAHL